MEQARAAREREERIEGIAQRAVRRVMHSGLLRGWTSWFDAWSEKVRLRRMLAASVARMQRPMLVAVLSRWKHSWGEAEKRAGRLSGMSQVCSP